MTLSFKKIFYIGLIITQGTTCSMIIEPTVNRFPAAKKAVCIQWLKNNEFSIPQSTTEKASIDKEISNLNEAHGFCAALSSALLYFTAPALKRSKYIGGTVVAWLLINYLVKEFSPSFNSDRAPLNEELQTIIKEAISNYPEEFNILECSASAEEFANKMTLLYATANFPLLRIIDVATDMLSFQLCALKLIEKIGAEHDNLTTQVQQVLNIYYKELNLGITKIRSFIRDIKADKSYEAAVCKKQDYNIQTIAYEKERALVEASKAQAEAQKAQAHAQNAAAWNTLLGNPSTIIEINHRKPNRNYN